MRGCANGIGRMVVIQGIACAFCTYGYAQTPVTLTLNPAQTTATAGGSLAGAPLTEQGSGSLTTYAEGPVNVVMSRHAITFSSAAIDLAVNGTWSPDIGGVAGLAPADTAGEVSVFFGLAGADMASRDVVFSTASDALTVTGTGFDATQVVFGATAGTVDYLGSGLAAGESGSESLVGSDGPTEDNNGVMVIQNGICTLTVPIQLDLPVEVPNVGTGNATYDGVLVATGAVPSEAIMAYSPTPSDLAVSVPLDSSLVWSSAYYAVSHQVYFGTDSAAVAAATTVSDEYMGAQGGIGFDPGGMDSSTTYYWRIDEVAQDSAVTKGTVWSFTTTSTLPFSETFEAGDPGMAGALDDLNGQHGWEVTPTDGALVQNVDANSGSQACRITSAIASHAFTGAPKGVTVEFSIKPTFSPGAPSGVGDCAAAFWVDESGSVGAYDGATERTSTAVTLTEDTWIKFNLQVNYSKQRWSLWANNVLVADDFAFHNQRTGFEAFKIQDQDQSTSLLDDVMIKTGPYGFVVLCK